MTKCNIHCHSDKCTEEHAITQTEQKEATKQIDGCKKTGDFDDGGGFRELFQGLGSCGIHAVGTDSSCEQLGAGNWFSADCQES